MYTISADGGTPRRVTYFEGTGAVGWMPDGKRIVCRRSGPVFAGAALLGTVPVSGGITEPLPLEFGDLASFAPDGRRFVFTRISRSGQGWFAYKGGMKNDIWTGDTGSKTFRKIYTTDGTNEFPCWAGERVCWVRDDGGQFSVVSARPDGSDVRRIAGPYRVEVRNLHSDGKRLIYEKGFGLEIADLATGKTQAVTFELASDLRYTRPQLVPANALVDSVSIGPTGKRVLVGTRGADRFPPRQRRRCPRGACHRRRTTAAARLRTGRQTYRLPERRNEGKPTLYCGRRRFQPAPAYP